MAEMNLSHAQMASDLGRSANSIKMKLKAMGLYIPKPSPRPWTEEEDRCLVGLYLEGLSFQDLAATFNRSENAVISRLVRLRAGLRPQADQPSNDPDNPF